MRIKWIELRGFRSFGSSPQRIDLNDGLTIVHAANSQGKSSLAEGLEFLLTGGSSRRDLFGGAKNEYDQCLRNVHLASTEPVWVRASVELDNGRTVEVRRELNADYTPHQDCRSTLYIDGIVSPSVAAVGLPLADGPLRSPILLAHTLRWVLTAAPTERANYFKALLDVTDLDLIRGELARLRDEHNRLPTDPMITKLEGCDAVPPVAEALRRSRVRTAGDLGEVERAVRGAVQLLLGDAGVTVPNDAGVSESADLLESELARRRAQVFPLDHLQVQDLLPAPSAPALPADAHSRYSEAVAAVDTEVARLLPIFHAVLTLPEVNETDHPLDCPVCATPQALTQARINELRRQVADNTALQDATARLSDWISGQEASATATARSARGVSVPAEQWSAAERDAHRASAEALGVNPALFDNVMATLADLNASRRVTLESSETWATAATLVRGVVNRIEPLVNERLEPLRKAADAVAREHGQLRTTVGEYRNRLGALSGAIRDALDRKVDTRGWADLLEFARRPADLAASMQTARRRAAIHQRLASAVTDVENAIAHVLDNRFAAMSDELRTWWESLRPGELVSFGEVRRRGGGKRYIDVKARLSPGAGRPGVARDAISVLSTSQLNALGLAAFLARCRIENAPLIVLDDPVPASDPEHRYTFADQTVSALLDAGVQLLVTTHDPELAELLQVSHAHRGVDEYTVILDDPSTGTALIRSRDEFEHLLRKAEQQMYSPLVDNRKGAGQALRDAAERLAKQVIVAHRKAAGQPVKLSDFDNKCLRDLIPLVTQYAVQSDEAGKWKAMKDILNPANHSTPPPESIALRNAHGNLRRLKKDHEAALPGLRIT